MPVYKANNGSWYFKCSINGRQFLRRGFSSRKEAVEAEILLKSENLLNTKSGKKIQKDLYFFDLVESYKNHRKKELKPTTYYGYCKLINRTILKYMKNVKVSRLTFSDFEKFRRQIDRLDLYENNRVLNLLIEIFDYLNIYFGIDIPYAKRLQKFKSYIPSRIDKEQVNKPVEFDLLKKYYAASNDYFKFYLLTTYIFGLRVSELRGLEVQSFNPEEKTLSIYKVTTCKCGLNKSIDLVPKSASSIRKYFLSERYLSLLRKFIEDHRLKGNHRLFYIKRKTNPISGTSIRRYLNQIEESNHLEHITPHGLRHGIASYLYSEGISFEDIGKYLGHKFHNVTMDVYIDMTKERQKAITSKIDSLIEKLISGD